GDDGLRPRAVAGQVLEPRRVGEQREVRRPAGPVRGVGPDGVTHPRGDGVAESDDGRPAHRAPARAGAVAWRASIASPVADHGNSSARARAAARRPPASRESTSRTARASASGSGAALAPAGPTTSGSALVAEHTTGVPEAS